MENKKTKFIKLDEDAHRQLKMYCALNGITIQDTASKIILNHIKKESK